MGVQKYVVANTNICLSPPPPSSSTFLLHLLPPPPPPSTRPPPQQVIDDNGNGKVDYDEYLELHSRLGALLIGPQDKVLQRRLADEDWKEDTGGGYVNVKWC